jgi:hypothetical protein
VICLRLHRGRNLDAHLRSAVINLSSSKVM